MHRKGGRGSAKRVRALIGLSLFGLVLASAIGGCVVSGDEGEPVWPANATELRVVDHGGGWPGACSYGGTTRTYAVRDRRVRWHVCQYPSGTFLEGEATLDATEARRLEEAARKLAPSRHHPCIADQNLVSIVVTTPTDEREYYDDYAGCDNERDYVSGVGDLSRVFDDLAAAHAMP